MLPKRFGENTAEAEQPDPGTNCVVVNHVIARRVLFYVISVVVTTIAADARVATTEREICVTSNDLWITRVCISEHPKETRNPSVQWIVLGQYLSSISSS